MASGEQYIQRKHNRSPDDAAEERSKRRKHSRHRSSHHHHHRSKSSKHHHETKQESEEIFLLNPNSRMENEDKEEGEILDEDYNNVVCNGELSKKNTDSDVESGEIQPDEVDAVDGYMFNLNLGTHAKGVEFSANTMDSVKVNMAHIDGELSNLALDESDNGKDTKMLYKEVDIRRDSRNYEVCESFDGVKSGKSSENRYRSSRSPSKLHDRSSYYREDRQSHVNKSNSRERAGDESDHERVVRQTKEKPRGSRDFFKDRERERSSSLCKRSHDRHGSRDSVGDREREKSRSLSRHNHVRHYSRDSVRDRERERSSSLSRHNQDRHDGRDIIDRHHSRAPRDRVKDMGRQRGRDRENRKDRARDRSLERKKASSRDRYKDTRHQKHEQHRGEPNNASERGVDLRKDEDEQDDFEEQVLLKLAEQEEEDIDKIQEESRKRREAILQKYKQQQLQNQAEQPRTEENGSAIIFEKTIKQPVMLEAAQNVITEALDNRNNGSDVDDSNPLLSVGKSPPLNGSAAMKREPNVGGLGDGTPKSERSTDMFYDDIFGESPAAVRKTGKGEGVQVERSGLNDNWDDAEGYYSYRLGEVLDGRYEVIAAHGKGVFSTVVRAKDLKPGIDDPEEVAIKIIRNNDTMYKAGLEELVILKKLVGADPEDRRHCVRFFSSFKYRNHLCLVFESLHMNLREVLKKFGRNIGLKLTAVRAYAKQLFIALKHLRNCGVLHSDIKPDNMLVNEAKNVLKLCDFGNAMFTGKNEITPYLVSRFYRAPEIILGLAYDHPMDIWSVGCCLYELYSGKVLFPGPSNNDMLRLQMELKGPFPKKMLRKGVFADQHFDQDLNFHASEEDPVTKKSVSRLLLNIKPKDIGNIIRSSPGEDPKMLANFKDLLERIFVLDPEKRMTVSQALNHPFITGK
ncbi:hypothetical protein GIB67_036834 [Kingdonia uniflora]|uniref:Serine/threonine-protein kinase PRP4 homolog n=1 Tax=Kingdonia uniflora TaxID=39325 RepID=A0A7J7LWY8_9MAGN|nr:hypothetical protein GIB67_036834 [Kingdonia uniflora]